MVESHVPKNIITPVLIVLLVISAFLIGSLWTKVSYLEGTGTTNTKQAIAAQPTAQPSNPYTPVKADTLNLDKVSNSDYIKGDRSAQLTWIEYSDLECPYCKKIHPDLQEVMDEYKGKIKWVYRHFPLNSIHPKAQKSAEAAECAGSLGGNDTFWNFINKSFEGSPNSLSIENLVQTAKSIGLDEAKFKTCVESGQFAEKVNNQLANGEKAGVTGTPGNFLLDNKGNAWVVPGALPYASLKQVIDQALAQK